MIRIRGFVQAMLRFPRIRRTFWGALIIRIIEFWGCIGVLLFSEISVCVMF